MLTFSYSSQERRRRTGLHGGESYVVAI